MNFLVPGIECNESITCELAFIVFRSDARLFCRLGNDFPADSIMLPGEDVRKVPLFQSADLWTPRATSKAKSDSPWDSDKLEANSGHVTQKRCEFIPSPYERNVYFCRPAA